MQTSAKFWGGIGFDLGSNIDRIEHKQATLLSVKQLKPDKSRWAKRQVGPNAAGSAGAIVKRTQGR